MTPWFDRVRFGRWDEIVERPNPAPDLPYVTAIWHYAQAMADVRQSRLESARRHYDALAKLAADPVMEKLMVWDRYSLANAVRIAERTVAAEIALARKDPDTAIAALREAVEIEDQIPYDEPPGWHAPVRQTLGVALLEAGRAVDAEAVYREELQRNPANGWSLRGLAESLRAQKRSREAAETEQLLAAAWANADVKPTASRL
jgi:tetratricopeptide (TPR) repeat protein